MRESEQQSHNLMDSRFHHNLQNKSSSFQAQSQQNDEPINFEKLLEAKTQAQIAHNHDIDIQSHPLTIPDVSNHSVRAKESCCFGNQDSVSVQPFELNQTLTFENPIDSLASILFLRLNLSMNMILNLKLVIQFHFLI